MSLDLTTNRTVQSPTAIYGMVEKIALSFWVYFPSVGGYAQQYGRLGSFASSGDAWGTNSGFLVYTPTAGTSFPRDIAVYQGNNTAPGATVVTVPGFVQDTWYHFGFMNDREDGTDVYVDGVFKGRALGARNNTASGYVGWSNWGAAQSIWFYLAEAAVWLETELSASDFATLAAGANPSDFPTGLDSYWPLRDSLRDVTAFAPYDPQQFLVPSAIVYQENIHPDVPVVPLPNYEARTTGGEQELVRSVSRPAKNLIASSGTATGKARGAKLDPGIG